MANDSHRPRIVIIGAGFGGIQAALGLRSDDACLAEVSTDEGASVFMLLTYTALLQLRQSLADRGAVAEFWEQ